MARKKENDYIMEDRFNLIHDPKPISYTSDVSDMFRILLWYTPNTDGYQADTAPIITEDSFDDETFGFFCNTLGMSEDNILCRNYDETENLDNMIRNIVPEDGICRMILRFNEEHTKTYWMFKHLRNTLAHGRFGIMDGTFIGFDNIYGKYNFHIRVDLVHLRTALESLLPKTGRINVDNPPLYIESMVRETVSKLEGFEIMEAEPTRRSRVDLCVWNEKLGLEVGLEIKYYRTRPRLNARKYQRYYNDGQKIMFLCIMPNADVDDLDRGEYNRRNMIILDKTRFKQFLQCKDEITYQIEKIVSD